MTVLKPNLPCCLLLLTAQLAIAKTNEPVVEIPTVAPEAVGMSSAKLEAVDRVMQGYVDDGEMVGGIAMIARRGKICFFEDYGMADRESGKAMNKDSILRFYSMTKAITTAAALMLHDEGKLDVNDPVSKYLPELSEAQVATDEGLQRAKNEMSVADLMRHTSGLTYGGSANREHNRLFKEHDPNKRDITLAEMAKRLKHVPLAFEPATRWEYGISTDVLGRVVEAAAGQPLDEFLSQRLFEPLGMRDTGFHVPEEKRGRFAACYAPKEGGFEAMPEEHEKFLSPPVFKSGGGGLVSTARDYMRFLLMIERGGELNGQRYLEPGTVALMTNNQLPEEAGWVRFGAEQRDGVGFSYGFSVVEKPSKWDPAAVVGEYGWGGAASTHYWVSPKDELVVITLEQVRPYRKLTEEGLKQLIYDAILD